jgi:hypothetical protein
MLGEVERAGFEDVEVEAVEKVSTAAAVRAPVRLRREAGAMGRNNRPEADVITAELASLGIIDAFV